MDEMLIPLQCSGINVGRICWTTVECRSETDYGKKKRKKVEIKNRSKNIYTVNWNLCINRGESEIIFPYIFRLTAILNAYIYIYLFIFI